jgi:hypothetical protein
MKSLIYHFSKGAKALLFFAKRNMEENDITGMAFLYLNGEMIESKIFVNRANRRQITKYFNEIMANKSEFCRYQIIYEIILVD